MWEKGDALSRSTSVRLHAQHRCTFWLIFQPNWIETSPEVKWIIPVSTSSPHLPCLAVLQVSRKCLTEPHTWATAWQGCGGNAAWAIQQLCLMSSKRLQTWTLIPSAVRRPDSNAECQDCPGRLSSDGTQWEQTVDFSRKHCNLQEAGVSLKMFDREGSIGSHFCFFYETSTFKGRHKASHSIWMWVCQLWNFVTSSWSYLTLIFLVLHS